MNGNQDDDRRRCWPCWPERQTLKHRRLTRGDCISIWPATITFRAMPSHNGINDVPNDVPNNDETDLVDSLAQASQLQASEKLLRGVLAARRSPPYDIGKYFAAVLMSVMSKGRLSRSPFQAMLHLRLGR